TVYASARPLPDLFSWRTSKRELKPDPCWPPSQTRVPHSCAHFAQGWAAQKDEQQEFSRLARSALLPQQWQPSPPRQKSPVVALYHADRDSLQSAGHISNPPTPVFQTAADTPAGAP